MCINFDISIHSLKEFFKMLCQFITETEELQDLYWFQWNLNSWNLISRSSDYLFPRLQHANICLFLFNTTLQTVSLCLPLLQPFLFSCTLPLCEAAPTRLSILDLSATYPPLQLSYKPEHGPMISLTPCISLQSFNKQKWNSPDVLLWVAEVKKKQKRDMDGKDCTNVTQELQQAPEHLQWGHRSSDQLYGTDKDLVQDTPLPLIHCYVNFSKYS